MQKLAEICIRRPIFASMIILALVVVGIAAYHGLAVDRFPSVDLPTVSVRTVLPGAPPELVETEVTERVEEAVNTVQGISELRSVTGNGVSNVMVTFDLKRDIDVAAQDVRDRVATITRDLQNVGADPPIIRKFNNDDQPIITIALTGQRSQKELGEIADKIVKVQLERSAGVGEVAVVGGLQRAMNIWLDADRLAAYELPVTSVREAVLRQSADVPGGNLTDKNRERAVRLPGRLDSADQFDEIVIAKKNGQVIRLKDIGHAEDGTKEQRSFSLLNGDPTVVLEVRRQSGENTVATIEAVKAKLESIRDQLPPDVRMEIIRDQSRYIEAALHEINVHLVLGSILASLVVLAFMRNWRSTIIAAVAIPASVVSTFGVMWWLDFTLNSVTMLALVLMVGVVIDDAIVVLENIFRFVEEKKMRPFDAAREATREIGLAVLATTLSLVVIFVPVSFMSSISGRFLYQFGITAAVAVLVSLLVSFTLTPMMSARLLKAGGGEHGSGDASRRGFYHWLDVAYTWMLKLSMRWRWGVAIAAAGIMLTAVPLYRVVKQEYVPSDVDEAEFSVNLTAPEGTSLTAMANAIREIEPQVRDTRGVSLVLTSVGGGFLGQVNTANMYVRIEPHEKRVFSLGRLWRETLAGHPMKAFEGNYSQRDVMNALRGKLRKYAQLRPAVRNFPSFNIGGGNFDVDFVIKGPELATLSKYAETLRNMTLPGDHGQPEIPGLEGIDTTLRLDKPELQIKVNRNRADDLGISPADLGQAVRLLIGGDERVSRFQDETIGEAYDVQLRLEEKDRLRPEQIETLFLPRRDSLSALPASGADGSTGGAGGTTALVELSNIATLQTVPSASRIDRLDRERMVSVRGSVAQGYAQADRIAAMRDAAAKLDMPAAYSTSVSGRARELERTFKEFLWAFLLSVIFMYIILAMNYESLIHPLTILLSLPLSVPFALLSLYWSGNTLNLYSALGILVLFGVVKKNAILQIDHMNGLRAKGMPRAEAIIQANRDRLRPILMTTLALVAGMLPLWLGTGPGAEERRAVAVVVIGGQSLSLLLTLLVTPVVYSLLDDAGALLQRWRQPPTPDGGAPREHPQPAREREAVTA
jgi:HAE1 family hydrophobic/amphiphilic exporter-1